MIPNNNFHFRVAQSDDFIWPAKSQQTLFFFLNIHRFGIFGLYITQNNNLFRTEIVNKDANHIFLIADPNYQKTHIIY